MTDNQVWVGPTKADEGMPEDLRWIAEHVSQWPDNYLSVDLVINDSVRPYGKCCNYFESRTEGKYAKPQWLQARKDLGLYKQEGDEMSEQAWSEWIEGNGIEPPHEIVKVKFRDGNTDEDNVTAYYWPIDNDESDIIAYRYRLDDNQITTDSDMHQDLEFLARNVSEWDEEGSVSCGKFTHVRKGISPNGTAIPIFGFGQSEHIWRSKPQWLQARKELGEIVATNQATGQKHDNGKPRIDLMPPNAELEVARVLAFGAEKYGPDNWRELDNLEARCTAAAMRHINAMRRGEKADDETGHLHAAHAICCLMFLAEHEIEQCKNSQQ